MSEVTSEQDLEHSSSMKQAKTVNVCCTRQPIVHDQAMICVLEQNSIEQLLAFALARILMRMRSGCYCLLSKH